MACSSGQPGAGPSLPVYTPQPTTVEATPTGAPTAAASASLAPFTPEGLSDPANSFTVTSLPEGLDADQQKVARAYVSYERALWLAARQVGADRSEVEATATGTRLEAVNGFLDKRQAEGKKADGMLSTKVVSVTVTPQSFAATVGVCADQRQMTVLDASGQDVTKDSTKHAFHVVYILEFSEGAWKVADKDYLEMDQC